MEVSEAEGRGGLADASSLDTMYFDPECQTGLNNYLQSVHGAPYMDAIKATDHLIDGFQSPLGMEALATVDWLLTRESVEPTLESVREGLNKWPAGDNAAKRKQRLFSDRLLGTTIDRLIAST